MTENNSLINSCIEAVTRIIEAEKRKIENRELLDLCKNLGGCFDAKTDAHFFHEMTEVAFNALIKRKYAHELLLSENPAKAVKEVLDPLERKLADANVAQPPASVIAAVFDPAENRTPAHIFTESAGKRASFSNRQPEQAVWRRGRAVWEMKFTPTRWI